MKVLHVIPSFYPAHFYGGPVQSVYALCRGLAREGCEVTVLTTNANGRETVCGSKESFEARMAEGLTVRYCARRHGEFFTTELLKLLPRYAREADVVHVTAVYSFPTIPALATARALGRPVVWSPRGSLNNWQNCRRQSLKGVWNRVCGMAAPRSLRFHVTSEQEVDEVRRRFPRHECALIENGVEAAAAAPRGPQRPGAPLRLGFLGKLYEIKGIENLVEALTHIRHDFPFSLTIAGRGTPEYEKHLEEFIASRGLSNDVRLIGPVEGAARERFFAECDVLVHPSHWENFGMSIAEALVRGVPVIASSRTPWRRVEETGCGLWVDNSAESLAEAVRRIRRMPIGEMGRRGREWMQAEFTWESKARQMAALYRELAGVKPAVTPGVLRAAS